MGNKLSRGLAAVQRGSYQRSTLYRGCNQGHGTGARLQAPTQLPCHCSWVEGWSQRHSYVQPVHSGLKEHAKMLHSCKTGIRPCMADRASSTHAVGSAHLYGMH